MNAVNSPSISGFCLLKRELPQIKIQASIISQLPTLKPTFSDSPTNSASKGEAPRLDCIVKAIPRVNSKIPPA